MNSPYDIRKRTPKEDQKALEDFLKNGGEIINLSDDNKNEYDQNLKNVRKKIPGAFNPFSKTDALKK
jgi:hypothetical protein